MFFFSANFCCQLGYQNFLAISRVCHLLSICGSCVFAYSDTLPSHLSLKKFNSPSALCTSGDWTAFVKSICSLLHIRKIFEVGISENLREQLHSLKLDILEKAEVYISSDVVYVYELVVGVIDISRLKDKGYETFVKDGFCDELDELRQIYEELPDFLEEVSSLELARLPYMSTDKFIPCIVYIQQIGYLLCIFQEKLDESILDNLQDFEFAVRR